MSIDTSVNVAYINRDKQVVHSIDAVNNRANSFTSQVLLIAPFNVENSMYVNFQLSNSIGIPSRYMELVGTINDEYTGGEDWYAWIYTISPKIMAAASAEVNSQMKCSFSEFRTTTSESEYNFLGFQSNEVTLLANYGPGNINGYVATDNDYMGVGTDDPDDIDNTISTATCYLVVNDVWTNQNQTVREFEEEKGILRESFLAESDPAYFSVTPNVSATEEYQDNSNLDTLTVAVSKLIAKVAALEEEMPKKMQLNLTTLTPTPGSASSDVIGITNKDEETYKITFEELRAFLSDQIDDTVSYYSDGASQEPPGTDLLTEYPELPDGDTSYDDLVIQVLNAKDAPHAEDQVDNRLWRYDTDAVSGSKWRNTQKAAEVTVDDFNALVSRVLDLEQFESNVLDGTVAVKKAEQDKDGNQIDTTYQKKSEKSVQNGYPSLNVNAEVPLAELPIDDVGSKNIITDIERTKL
jgi:hypothetical protein